MRLASDEQSRGLLVRTTVSPAVTPLFWTSGASVEIWLVPRLMLWSSVKPVSGVRSLMRLLPPSR